MKYSFRLFETGPEFGNIKGPPPNLQSCPQCETVNLKWQATCIKCGRALDAEKKPADNGASASAGGAAMEGKDFSAGMKFPDILKTPSAGAEFPPLPDMMANSQFSSGNEQKWLRWAWGLVLLLVLLAATGLLVFSLQPSSAIPESAKILSRSEDSLPPAAPDKVPAATASAPVQHRPTVESAVAYKSAQPAANRIRSVPEVPEVPVVPVAGVQQETPAAANAGCSDAQQALALCN